MSLPVRAGEAPTVSGPVPQSQRSQNGPVALAEELVRRAVALPGVALAHSRIGEGSRDHAGAFTLSSGDTSRCLIGNEFGHLHLHADNAGHFVLSPAMHAEVLEKGWGLTHPLAGQSFGSLNVPVTNTLVFSPRDAEELEIVWSIIQDSYSFVTFKV